MEFILIIVIPTLPIVLYVGYQYVKEEMTWNRGISKKTGQPWMPYISPFPLPLSQMRGNVLYIDFKGNSFMSSKKRH